MGFENSGRRPKPTALKVLRGNPGKRPLNQAEPVVPDLPVVKPAYLSHGASAVWDELAPICLAMKTLTAADVRPFSTLCELQAALQEISAGKDGEGFSVMQAVQQKEDGPVEVRVDALLKNERDTATTIRPYYALFGLEPVSRARIHVKKPEPVSKWADAL